MIYHNKITRDLIIKMTMIALVDAILANFYLRIFPLDFTINLAVAILPIYYYLERKLNPITTAVFVSLIGLAFRTVTGFYYYGSFFDAFWRDFNFLYFDLVYGLVFYLIFFKRKEKNLYLLFIAALMSDFLGNATEFITRFGIESYLVGNVMGILLLVAVVRALITTTLIVVIKYYRSFLRKEEHDARYRAQMNMIANLRGEIYFLKNNMDKVENVMDEAFELYRSFELLTSDEQKNMALNIAKNVHEVKKNYFRTVEGIDEVISRERLKDHLSVEDFMNILQRMAESMARASDKDIEFEIKYEKNIWIKEHSMLMTVLSNLISNSVEAIDEIGKITLSHRTVNQEHFFSVEDNGIGMSESERPYVYNPGYSTKYDVTSGNMNRGIGLTLVKDIVESFFKGVISVESEEGIGTKFTIQIPKSAVEQ